MRVLYFIIIILFANNCTGQVQRPKDLGFGEVSIGFFWFPPTDTIKLDTAHHKFIQYDYHIYHDKIFKSGDINPHSSKQNDKNQLPTNRDTLHNILSMSMVNPTYLIDWNEKLVYTFYKKNSNTYISLDSLNRYMDDVFYRVISNGLNTHVKFIFDTLNRIKLRLGDIECYQAKYKSTQNKGWRQFTYTKKQLSIYPPLNSLLNNSFPYPITSFDYESNNDSYADQQKHTAIVRVEIVYLNKQQPPKYLFKVPHNLQVKKNVSKIEMYNNKN